MQLQAYMHFQDKLNYWVYICNKLWLNLRILENCVYYFHYHLVGIGLLRPWLRDSSEMNYDLAFLFNGFVEISTYCTIHSFKMSNSVWFGVYSQKCTTITAVNFWTFSSCQKETEYFGYHPISSSNLNPKQPRIHLLSL